MFVLYLDVLILDFKKNTVFANTADITTHIISNIFNVISKFNNVKSEYFPHKNSHIFSWEKAGMPCPRVSLRKLCTV